MSINVPDEDRPIDPDTGLPAEPVPDEERPVPLDDDGDVIGARGGDQDDE
ncbi:hypothetical protein H9651_12730 [Microbacterium sp. Sa4CUA7]|uniref:Uncharacterized protein n=1 Tax=Microbacterium pullorum TaxID=2762236 RepID=A0ABR8S4V3_9MICO|nr:hypothetical protein [Microbacterium pullorum]MBD7958507.1 hypothetical protein [Microbacterium pullorum]